MQLWPWEYLFQPFNKASFPDLFMPLTIASVVSLIHGSGVVHGMAPPGGSAGASSAVARE